MQAGADEATDSGVALSALHRALTAPWQALTARRGARGAPGDGGIGDLGAQRFRGERSAPGVRGGDPSGARGRNGSSVGDISAHQVVARRAALSIPASTASRRSLFTVDGLPEPSVHDTSVATTSGDGAASGGGGGGGGSSHAPPWRHRGRSDASASGRAVTLTGARGGAPHPSSQPQPAVAVGGSLHGGRYALLAARLGDERLGLFSGGPDKAGRASAKRSCSALPAAAAPQAPAGRTDWDDATNPMSFCYDPALDRNRPSRLLAAADPAAAAAPAYDGGGGALDDDEHTLFIDMPFALDPASAAAAAAAAESGVVLPLAASRAPSPGGGAPPAGAVQPVAPPPSLRLAVEEYARKWRGVNDTLMPMDTPLDILWTWLGSFLSIAVVAVLNAYLSPQVSVPLLIASFGASAVLLFGVPASKLAQPRNFIGGQVISALVGILVRLVFSDGEHLVWLSSALGMSLALAAMQITRTVHPPGGASALIAASAVHIGPWRGFQFVLTVFFGSMAMLVVALLVNNLSSRRRYPTYWRGH